MLNRVVLVGRLTKDPEYRTTPSGVSVATFTLAVNRTFTNAQGEREADFINCVVFRRQADNVNNYLSKGSLAGVDGRLQSRNYENQEGRRVFVTEVVCDSVQFLEPKMRNKMVANVNKMNSKITVKDSVVNNQDKTIRTIIHQTRNNLIIHLQMQTDRLISVMMTYHSNKINEIKAKNYQRRHTIMAGGPRRGGRRRKSMLFHSKWYYTYRLQRH